MFLLGAFLVLVTGAHGFVFNVTYLSVPAVVNSSQRDVDFECRYEGNFTVLSWFKGPREFFRYKPDDTPSIMSFPLTGVEKVEMVACGLTMCRLHLSGVSEDASGMYRCDIERAIRPYKFATKLAYMNVSRPNHRRPYIDGLAEEYYEGDTIQAYCHSEKSTGLKWYINNIEIESLRGSRKFKYASERRIFMGMPPSIIISCTVDYKGQIYNSPGIKVFWVGDLTNGGMETNPPTHTTLFFILLALIYSVSVTNKLFLQSAT